MLSCMIMLSILFKKTRSDLELSIRELNKDASGLFLHLQARNTLVARLRQVDQSIPAVHSTSVDRQWPLINGWLIEWLIC